MVSVYIDVVGVFEGFGEFWVGFVEFFYGDVVEG